MSVSPVPASSLPPAAHPAASRRMGPTSAAALPAAVATEPATARPDKSFSFWDLIDIVNPLQHIPVVSSLYRDITGDEIGGVARVVGGALFGGFAGAAFGVLNAAVADNTGHDIGDTVLSGLTGGAAAQPATIADAAQTIDATAMMPPVTPVARNDDALFDLPASGLPAASRPDAGSPIPLIEVRPREKALEKPTAAATGSALPHARDVAELDAQAGPSTLPAAPQPVAKAKFEQAMLDALLKMQSERGDDGSDAASDG